MLSTKFLPVSLALFIIFDAQVVTLFIASVNHLATVDGKFLTKLIMLLTNSLAFVAPVVIKFWKNELTFVKTSLNNVPILGNNSPKPFIIAVIICGKALTNSTITIGIA